jgi:hypothetical protein
MIKAIETRYKGYRFRSRLEARWAVFFDSLEVKWEYERQGYDLGAAGWYLPDFWLPTKDVWVEVKGGECSQEDRNKVWALRRESKKNVVLIGDLPEQGEKIKAEWDGVKRDVEPDRLQDMISRMTDGNNDQGFDERWGVNLGCPMCGDSYTHFGKPDYRDVEFKSWYGRGDSIRIPMWCEVGGHEWVLRLGHHKGNSFLGFEDIKEQCLDFGWFLAGANVSKISYASARARSARFEHGESGAA